MSTQAMRLALTLLEEDRLALITCHAWPAGSGVIPENDRAGTKALRDYDEAIAALRAALADDGWQPIETAPRDADILVYGLAQVWTDSCPVFWQGQAGWDEEYASWLTTAHDDKGEPLKVIPTHWMPLPAAPQPAHTLPDAPKD